MTLSRKRGGTRRMRAPVVRLLLADATPNQTNASAASARLTPPSPRIEKWWNTRPVPSAEAKVRPATNSSGPTPVGTQDPAVGLGLGSGGSLGTPARRAVAAFHDCRGGPSGATRRG